MRLLEALPGVDLRVVADRTLRNGNERGARAMRILFPFLGSDLSSRALDAALRLAAAEDATLGPRLPRHACR